MRLLRRLVPVVSLAVGSATGAIAIALGAGGEDEKSVPLSHFVSRISPAENKVPLRPREIRVLVVWAQGVRTCLERTGTKVAPPTPRDAEVVMRVDGLTTPVRRMRFVLRASRCGTAAGDPQLHTSFVLQRDGAFHLYRPRACLLPVVR